MGIKTNNTITMSLLPVFRDLFLDELVLPVNQATQKLMKMNGELLLSNRRVTDTSYTYDFAVPGLTKDDVDVRLNGRELTVKVKSENETTDENETSYHREFHSFTGSRTVTLPADAVADETTKANVSNGVLSVVFNRAKNADGHTVTVE